MTERGEEREGKGRCGGRREEGREGREKQNRKINRLDINHPGGMVHSSSCAQVQQREFRESPLTSEASRHFPRVRVECAAPQWAGEARLLHKAWGRRGRETSIYSSALQHSTAATTINRGKEGPLQIYTTLTCRTAFLGLADDSCCNS